MKRQNFPAKVKLQAWERCNGHCEQCTAKLGPTRFTYDHINPDYLGGEPVLANCQVLCSACDSSKLANRDRPNIDKARRVRRKHLGIKRPPRRGFRGWRKFNGDVVWNKPSGGA